MVIGTLSRVKTFKDPYGEISKVNLYVKLSNEGMKIFMSELRAWRVSKKTFSHVKRGIIMGMVNSR